MSSLSIIKPPGVIVNRVLCSVYHPDWAKTNWPLTVSVSFCFLLINLFITVIASIFQIKIQSQNGKFGLFNNYLSPFCWPSSFTWWTFCWDRFFLSWATADSVGLLFGSECIFWQFSIQSNCTYSYFVPCTLVATQTIWCMHVCDALFFLLWYLGT